MGEGERERKRERWSIVESISGAFPCSREPTIFPFSRSNQRSGGACDIRPSAFTFFQPCRLASPGAIVGDFANPIERPFFHFVLLPTDLVPSPRDVSIPFACFPLPFFGYGAFLFNRYYAIPTLDRGNWEIQSDPTIRKIFLPVAFVLPPLQTGPAFPSSFKLRLSSPFIILYTHLHGG